MAKNTGTRNISFGDEEPAKTPPKASSPKPVSGMVADVNSTKNTKLITDKNSQDEVLRYAQLPGTILEFDPVRMLVLEDSFVEMLPATAQKAYWLAFAEFDERRKRSDRALFETPSVVDPMAKLLDGPKGMANPLTRDSKVVEALLPGYYVTWRIEGGQGDLEAALQAGFRVMRRPKDDTERTAVDPLDWSGERWMVRDGTSDPASGDQIYNVMVVIRERAWKDHLAAMSMVSHNKYSQNKRDFVEGVDNISRDMLSSKERIEVADLDEMHAEELTVRTAGKQ
jgi:hypothetical protein